MTETQRVPIEVATDFSMEQQLRAEGSLTQEATKALIGVAVVEFAPEVVEQAGEAAAQLVRDTTGLLVAADPGEVSDVHFAFTDEDGDPVYATSTRADGTPSNENLAAYRARGVVISDEGDGGREFTDEYGNPSWLAIGANGGIEAITKWAIANTLHEYRGPDEPFVYPGNFIEWTETTADGEPIEVWRLRRT